LGLNKRAAAFGLDIGSSSIKAVELTRARRTYLLKAAASVPLGRDAISDGNIRNPAAVTEAIAACVDKAGITTTSVTISLSGRDSIVKRIPLPKIPRAELADAILLEAEHHIPFGIDEVFLDYEVVAETAHAISMLLVATKKAKVLEYVAAVEAAGLNPVVVDLDAFAIQNQFEVNHAVETTDAVALIDIGASVTKINVVRAGAPLFARDVPLGGNTYTDAIADSLSIPFDMAESLKRGRSDGASDDEVAQLLAAISHELSLEVQRTFDYVASAADWERIGAIVISGGGARLSGLVDILTASWGVPVELAQPFRSIGCGSRQWADADGALFAVALGLALRRPGDKSA